MHGIERQYFINGTAQREILFVINAEMAITICVDCGDATNTCKRIFIRPKNDVGDVEETSKKNEETKVLRLVCCFT